LKGRYGAVPSSIPMFLMPNMADYFCYGFAVLDESAPP
jgi:hypothetical protein